MSTEEGLQADSSAISKIRHGAMPVTTESAFVDYRPELDGIRTLCILFTLCNHLPGTPRLINGSVGVDIFFALSGWLITWILLKEKRKTGSISLRKFYLRRIFRIIPLYYITIGLYILASLTEKYVTHGPHAGSNFALALPYLFSFNGEYMTKAAGDIFGHAWTLGIEEKFYILWPLGMFLFFSRIPAAALLVILVVMLALFLAPDRGYLLRGYAGLAFGAGLATLVMRFDRIERVLTTRAIAPAALLLMALAYVAATALRQPLWNILISFAGAWLVASVWFNRAQLTSRLLSWAPMAFMGRLTYGIYLIHILVINVVVLLLQKLNIDLPWISLFATTYGVSAVVALALHAAVEVPLIATGRRLAARLKTNTPPSARRQDFGETLQGLRRDAD